jgi:hypothetical protein
MHQINRENKKDLLNKTQGLDSIIAAGCKKNSYGCEANMTTFFEVVETVSYLL